MVVLKELSNMFWGLTIDGGRRYSQTVDRPFHVSMAALEINPQSPEKAHHVQVMLQQGSSQFLLCNLGPGSHLQQQLDLQFSSGEAVEFFLVGKGVVHLTGSLMEEDTEFADDYAEDEYDTESDGAPDLMPAGDLDSDDEEGDEDWQPKEETVGSKRKASDIFRSKGKKMKITELDGDEDGEEDDEDDEYDSSFIDDETLEEEEESVEDEEEEEEEADSLMDVLTSKPPKSSQTSPSKKTNALDTSAELSPSKKKKKKKHKEGKTGESPPAKEAASPAGDAANGDASTKKKKKKKKKKNKQENASQQEQNSVEQPPQSPTTKSSPAVGKKRTVAGGTSVEDVKIGHGPEAKPGTMVSVFYSGILAKSNKRFDSCLKGKPFRFRLGRGEVIKGWDTGLIGMKVGGKRKIVVPPSQGYGNARQGPIPPGSTLVFDVEMKAVS